MYSEKQNAYYRKRRKTDVEFRNYQRKKNRECYLKHKESRDLRAKNYQRQAKIEVIGHYSKGTNKCACCGVEGLIFLTIDHINGDGARERKAKRHKTGTMFYIWLRTNGYHVGYQVLCHNCNQAKRQLSQCPHTV